MAMERKVIGGHRFVNEADYEAAQRDLIKIEEIKAKIDFHNPKSVEALYNDLQTGQISFESVLGQEFDDEVYETYMNFRQGNHRDAVLNEGTDRKKISLDDFDENMQEQILLEIKRKEQKRKLVLIICAMVAVISLAYFGVYEYMSLRTDRDAQALADAIKDDNDLFVSKPEDDKYYASLIETEDGQPVVLTKYEDLYNQNKSLIGWVKIADTVIDYPVMQTVNNEYYLDHNFHQEYDKNGSIFLDASCSVYPRSMNLIIYGHHMKSGKMFGSLQKYQNESYYKEHKYIEFDSIYETGTYEVMFVFRDKVYSQEDVNFKYYEFIDANSEEEFNSYMDEMAAISYYDTGVIAQYGDRLITLSTCDYQQDNGRFVVVARRVTE